MFNRRRWRSLTFLGLQRRLLALFLALLRFLAGLRRRTTLKGNPRNRLNKRFRDVLLDSLRSRLGHGRGGPVPLLSALLVFLAIDRHIPGFLGLLLRCDIELL